MDEDRVTLGLVDDAVGALSDFFNFLVFFNPGLHITLFIKKERERDNTSYPINSFKKEMESASHFSPFSLKIRRVPDTLS